VTTSDRWTERLSDYVDGDLRPAERTELERHLETCAECRGVLAELRSVVERAHTLPTVAAAPDLWPAIAARIAEHGAVGAPTAPAVAVRRESPTRGWFADWRFSLTVPQLAAASFALMLLSGGAVWTIMRTSSGVAPSGTSPQMAADQAPGASGSPSSAAEGGPLAAVPTPAISESTAAPELRRVAAPAPAGRAVVANFGAERYDHAIADLQAVLTEHRNELDPRTIEVLERNLAIIDEAIEQARRALAADPASSYLHGHIAENMKRKYELLRRAASAVATVES
jgi:anti-sigma factor RsiW